MAIDLKRLHEIFPNPPEGLEIDALDTKRIPAHVAVIMDGNGRWAKARGLSRGEGHKAGIRGVREVITACNDVGVRYLTIYSFSTENWKRPLVEVTGLMNLFAETLVAELAGLGKENVRIVVLGREADLPKKTRETFARAVAETADNTGMTLAIAVNYGARAEITDAVRSLAADVAAGELKTAAIDEKLIASRLYTGSAGVPDPDLLIRTSGESRISNFLLWQIAYSEIYISDVLWPDFDRYEFIRALLEYQGRERRFGRV